MLMPKMNWIHHIKDIGSILRALSVQNSDGHDMDIEDAFTSLVKMTLKLRKNEGTIFLIGNGASASIASHVAADLAKNAHVRTEVFSDLSLITAIANDIGFDEVFSEPLRRRIKRGDMLIAISSSGQSVNILRASEEAKHLGGYVVTLSAIKKGNPLRGKGHLNMYVPAKTYGIAETCHAAILHYWIDRMVLFGVKGAGTRRK